MSIRHGAAWLTAAAFIASSAAWADLSINCFPKMLDYETGSVKLAERTEWSLVRADGEGSDANRGYMVFNIADIPDGSTIKLVRLCVFRYENNEPSWYVTRLHSDPRAGLPGEAFDDINYADPDGFYLHIEEATQPPGPYVYELPGAAADLQARLADDWFGVGFHDPDPTGIQFIRFHGWFEPLKPYLSVVYTPPGVAEPLLAVGGRVNPQLQDNWVGPGTTRIQLLWSPPEGMEIESVAFRFSTDVIPWTACWTDSDGGEDHASTFWPSEDSGDGWSGYFSSDLLVPPPSATAPLHFRADIYTTGGVFQGLEDAVFDPTPPYFSLDVEDEQLFSNSTVTINLIPENAGEVANVFNVTDECSVPDKGVPRFCQFKPEYPNDGSTYCGPTAAAACLRYFDTHGRPNVVPDGVTDESLVKEMGKRCKTDRDCRGTSDAKLKNGITSYLNDHGQANNFDVSGEGSFTTEPYRYWKVMRRAIENCWNVLPRIVFKSRNAQQHWVTATGVRDCDGKTLIAVMDPACGILKEYIVDTRTGKISEPDGTVVGRIIGDVIVAPRGGFDQPGRRVGGPGDATFTVTFPRPGNYRLDFTLEDTSGHRHTETRFVHYRPGWPTGWSEVESLPAASGRPVKDGAWLAFGNDGLLYAAKGYKTGDFFRYEPVGDSWSSLAPLPWETHTRWYRKPPYKGAAGCYDGGDLIYATQGNNSLGFWAYSISDNSWRVLPDVPLLPSGKRVKGGADLAYVVHYRVPYVYLLKGYGTDFCRFNIMGDSWEILPAAPTGTRAKWGRGSWLAADGMGNIYAHKAKYHELWRFDVHNGTWDPDSLPSMPYVGRAGRSKKLSDGGSACWSGNRLYALKGGNTSEFWCYDVETRTWSELDTIPSVGRNGIRKRIKYGADIVADGLGTFFALKGNKTHEMWRYVRPAGYSRPTTGYRAGAQAGQPAAGSMLLAVSPNPTASGFATLRYCLPKPGPVAVTIFDVAGRSVFCTRAFGHSTIRSLPLDLRKLASGVYLVRLDADGYSQTQKLVVQK